MDSKRSRGLSLGTAQADSTQLNSAHSVIDTKLAPSDLSLLVNPKRLWRLSKCSTVGNTTTLIWDHRLNGGLTISLSLTLSPFLATRLSLGPSHSRRRTRGRFMEQRKRQLKRFLHWSRATTS